MSADRCLWGRVWVEEPSGAGAQLREWIWIVVWMVANERRVKMYGNGTDVLTVTYREQTGGQRLRVEMAHSDLWTRGIAGPAGGSM